MVRVSRWSPLYVFATVSALLLAAVAGAGLWGRDAEPPPASSSVAGLDGFEQGSVRVGRDTVHYVIGGDGPPVVLLHGWPQTWWIWHEVMPELAADHTVIAFDLPGLGDSSQPARGYDKRTTARRIHQAVRRLGFQQVDLVGHDIGAHVAYPYAREFPSGVRSVTVMDAPLPGLGLEDFFGISWHFLFNQSPAPIPEEIMDDDDVEFYLGMLFNGAVDPSRIDQQVYFDAYSDPAVRTAGYEYYRAFPADGEYNQRGVSRPISTPVLAIGGEFTFGPAVAASFAQVAADVRAVTAPGSAHFIPEENPRFVIDCLRLFLGTESGPPSSPELAGCVR